MIDNIITYCIRHKLVVLVFILVLVAWGTYSLQELPIDAVPDITDNQAQVITNAPSLAALEVEQYITVPLELVLQNTPGMIELRSVSRAGMSVITAVFEENADIYTSRQLILERLNSAMDQLPPGTSVPQMAPISTGLGEIFQYTVRTAPSVSHRYSPHELRAIQDWVIKRQLAGINGVAEVNSFGGYLKQYEVSIRPERLMAWEVSLQEIFTALESNNANAGGAYIEKGPRAYFIRTEGMYKSMDEIANTVIRTHPSIVTIQDVADVSIGEAPRFGAVTRNGEGEVVGGIVMMLKGSNSSKVVREVKERLPAIQASLPEGIIIEPYLDREKLVNRAISTVTTNLIEGGLIVIGVLVLMLGNYRAGLIVASVIPLSMLFAFGMMNLFGVSANLMSLGAIDFGLIVDGSIIVVESIVHRLNKNFNGRTLSRNEMDAEVNTAASRIRSSAAFGELIILIVYLPILSLGSIEGKMFRPMAQTVSFAIFGALILSMTYIPAASAFFLKRSIRNRTTLSDRIMNSLTTMYVPSLAWALNHRRFVVITGIVTLIVSAGLFARLGGEFIPTLEEGDLALHQVLPPGTSLKQSINSSGDIQKVLLDNFPEVEQVVTKIGTAEIPTDLMPMELGDIMVILKEKEEWTSASTREELIEKMDLALAELTGLDFEYTQPIQMRFNELMTGVRQDIAIKIYGDDLNKLRELGSEAEGLIQDIEGTDDIRVEVVEGLPQLVVRPVRQRLNENGITIEDINTTIATVYAGTAVGSVYENERRFDLVVRMKDELRDSVDYINQLLVQGVNGQRIPLRNLANIGLESAPVQISRDNAQRRLVIGVNSRNRDVASLVAEIQEILEQNLDLPAGYYLTYGGQFENFEAAKARLSIAVPAALILIVLLLYMTFHSLRDTLLVITCIPFAAVGGVLALTLRGMPFSISAGVGFIALFGVAVLNGIVLMAYFRELEDQGISDVFERVRQGTRLRLRPVLMTAAVASLGFLPMATSASGGAEVQRPLATVVIGGLITSTLLTLILLPVLLTIVENWKPRISSKTVVLLIAALMLPALGFTQSLEYQAFLDSVKQNYLLYQNTQLEVEAQKVLEGTAWDLNNPLVSFQTEERKGDQAINTWGISQQMLSPAVYGRTKQLLQTKTMLTEREQRLVQLQLLQRSSMWYLEMSKLQGLIAFWEPYTALFQELDQVANLYYQEGAMDALQYARVRQLAAKLEAQFQSDRLRIQSRRKEGLQFLNVVPETWPDLESVSLNSDLNSKISSSPEILLIEKDIELKQKEQAVARARMLPGLYGFGGLQSVDGESGFVNVQVGLSIPVWNKADKSSREQARIKEEILQREKEFLLRQQSILREELKLRYQNLLELKRYYSAQEENSADLNRVVQIQIEQGSINLVETLMFIEEAYRFKTDFLNLTYQLKETELQWMVLNDQFGDQQ